jgi:hypothetical protein
MPEDIAGRVARVDRLRASRAKDSQAKRETVKLKTKEMLDAGIRISFARLAREARVSTWLVYNIPELRKFVEAAMETQRREGITPPRHQAPASDQSFESLRTDLALSREEIRSLRAEVAKLRGRLRLKLGAEAEGVTSTELIARIQEVEGANAALGSLVADRDSRIRLLVEERRALDAELEGKTEALRRMMFTVNTDS